MKIIILTILFCFAISTRAVTPTQQGLPSPPEGFSWQKLDEIKAAALLPKGWFFKKEEVKGTLAYFITQEDIDTKGQYETGLTIQVFRPPQPNTVEEVSKTIITGYSQKKELIKAWKIPGEKFAGWGYQAKIKGADDSVTMMHAVILSNVTTKTFYLIVFESSEAKWESALKIGEKVQMVALNDKI